MPYTHIYNKLRFTIGQRVAIHAYRATKVVVADPEHPIPIGTVLNVSDRWRDYNPNEHPDGLRHVHLYKLYYQGHAYWYCEEDLIAPTPLSFSRHRMDALVNV